LPIFARPARVFHGTEGNVRAIPTGADTGERAADYRTKDWNLPRLTVWVRVSDPDAADQRPAGESVEAANGSDGSRAALGMDGSENRPTQPLVD